jgi:hypothetical protein
MHVLTKTSAVSAHSTLLTHHRARLRASQRAVLRTVHGIGEERTHALAELEARVPSSSGTEWSVSPIRSTSCAQIPGSPSLAPGRARKSEQSPQRRKLLGKSPICACCCARALPASLLLHLGNQRARRDAAGTPSPSLCHSGLHRIKHCCLLQCKILLMRHVDLEHARAQSGADNAARLVIDRCSCPRPAMEQRLDHNDLPLSLYSRIPRR